MHILNRLTLLSLLPVLTSQQPHHHPPDQQPLPEPQQHPFPFPFPSHSHPVPNQNPPHRGVSPAFFLSLERLARLVDITYCVNTPPGSPGISPPFSCASRCSDFPSLRLIQTFNTGMLLSDSCGFIAIDHGEGDGGKQGQGKKKKRRGEIILAFRGTYSLANAIVDLSTVPQEYVPYPPLDNRPGHDPDHDDHNAKTPRCDNCTVHMGFMASWRNAREVVLPLLKQARARYPEYGVHIVGHSLGGAVAALAGLELKLGLGWEEVIVTTFGEPRVGNEGLVRYLDGAFGLGGEGEDGEGMAYRRVTHVGDPVPLLPLTEWGYRSHAGEVFIGKSELQPEPGDLRLCRGDDDPACIGGAEKEDWVRKVMGLVRGWWVAEEEEEEEDGGEVQESGWFPARLKLWQLFFAHRDYFWRLGLCVPGGDPWDWGRRRYNLTSGEEADEMGDL